MSTKLATPISPTVCSIRCFEKPIFNQFIAGWVDDSVFIRRNQESNEDLWSNGGPGGQAGAFTTGRQRGRNAPVPPPPAVKPRTQVSPTTP